MIPTKRRSPVARGGSTARRERKKRRRAQAEEKSGEGLGWLFLWPVGRENGEEGSDMVSFHTAVRWGMGKGPRLTIWGGGARPTAARPRWVLGWCRSAWNRGGGGRLTGGVGRHGAGRCGSNGV
jgi:hypothetical protein